MNYQIIKNEYALREFIEWLPELKPSEKFYISLLGRNKYLQDKTPLKTDKLSLKRFSSNKKFLFRKIQQLEVPLGAYTYGKEDLPVPPECLVLYITPNPRDLEKAAKATIIELQKKTWSAYDGYNPHSICLSSIQESAGTVKWYDFDFDAVELDATLELLKKVVNIDCCSFIKTRGGFHVLVEIAKVSPEFKKSWNSQISKIKGCDVRGTSTLVPIPGCVQSGHVPTLIKTDSSFLWDSNAHQVLDKFTRTYMSDTNSGVISAKVAADIIIVHVKDLRAALLIPNVIDGVVLSTRIAY